MILLKCMRELQSKDVKPPDMAANDNTISLYESAPFPKMYQYGRRNPANSHKRREKHIQSPQNWIQ